MLSRDRTYCTLQRYYAMRKYYYTTYVMRCEYLGIVYRIVLFYDHRGRPMCIIIIIIPSLKNNIITRETVIAKFIDKNHKQSMVI